MLTAQALLISLATASGFAAALPQAGTSTAPAYPICTSTAAFASVDKSNPRLFNYNGTGPSYFAGTNAWWASHILSDSDLKTVFTQIKSSGLQVVRVWGFGSVNSDPGPGTVWFQLLNSGGQTINYGSNGIARLDAVVSFAEQYGLKIVLPFVNNWSDLGGIASYTTAFGGTATSWYTDAKSQQVYRDYIALLVNRYKCSPAIFAWELGNEPRCNGCATSVITNWATSISAYIKSLDSKHMVTLGDEGWFAPGDGYGDGSYPYGGGEGVDFVKNLAISTLDYGTAHLYPDGWGEPTAWGSTWIQQHDDAGAKAGKPVVLEEYGSGSGSGNHLAGEQPWQQAVLNSSIAMDQFWQFGSTLSSISGLGDSYTITYGTAEYQVLVNQHAADMSAKKPGPGSSSSATLSAKPTSSSPSTTPPPTTSCTQTLCADFINSCGRTYGGCYPACSGYTTPKFTDPGCPTTTLPPTSTSSLRTSSTKSTASSTSTGAVAPHWGQCGGQGWTGPTVCAAPYTCKVSNQYYSQCL